MIEFAVVVSVFLITVLVAVFLVKFTYKMNAERYEWRKEKLGEMLYLQNTPSWDTPWEKAEQLVKDRYLKRADEILKFTDRTVPR